MRGRTLVVTLMVAGAVWAWGAVPALAGGAGGMFVDVSKLMPRANSAVASRSLGTMRHSGWIV